MQTCILLTGGLSEGWATFNSLFVHQVKKVSTYVSTPIPVLGKSSSKHIYLLTRGAKGIVGVLLHKKALISVVSTVHTATGYL